MVSEPSAIVENTIVLDFELLICTWPFPISKDTEAADTTAARSTDVNSADTLKVEVGAKMSASDDDAVEIEL